MPCRSLAQVGCQDTPHEHFIDLIGRGEGSREIGSREIKREEEEVEKEERTAR